jgi:histone H3/H4
MIQEEFIEKIKTNLSKNCCLSINERVFPVIVSMIMRIIFLYVDASSKLAKHCDRDIILLKDIHLVQDFIENQYIIISTEVHKDIHQKIDQGYKNFEYSPMEHVGGSNKKSLNKYISSKDFKKLCNENLKNMSIDARASNKILENINEFLDSFLNQCKKHCTQKKTNQLEESDIVYVMSQD